jgi:hypothetical protein
MIYSFEQAWHVIGGEHKTSTMEILEALEEKISDQERMASKLFHAKKFETLTSVEQERNAFVQVMYGFQKLSFLDNGDENESEIWKAARAKREEMDRSQNVDPKDIEAGQRVTFQPHDGKTTLTGTVKEVNEREVVLQCGRATIPALRDKGTFAEAPEPDRTATKEYAQKQAQRHAGEKGDVFTAKGEEAAYHGAIVELTPTYAIQQVGEDAILHRLKDLEPCKEMIREGAEVSIAKGAKGTVTVKPWNRDQEGHAREENREHAGIAR